MTSQRQKLKPVLHEVSAKEAKLQEARMWHKIGENQTLHGVRLCEAPPKRNKVLVEAFNAGKARKPFKAPK